MTPKDPVTHQEKSIVLDIYEDLAKELNWPLCYINRQAEMERTPFRISTLLNVEHFGKNHPKFPKIAHLFTEEPQPEVNCHNRSDWWTAFVKMLDDSKLYLNEADRKELYLDLRDLIGHRLSRREY